MLSSQKKSLRETAQSPYGHPGCSNTSHFCDCRAVISFRWGGALTSQSDQSHDRPEIEFKTSELLF